jgi:hypothetical protein
MATPARVSNLHTRCRMNRPQDDMGGGEGDWSTSSTGAPRPLPVLLLSSSSSPFRAVRWRRTCLTPMDRWAIFGGPLSARPRAPGPRASVPFPSSLPWWGMQRREERRARDEWQTPSRGPRRASLLSRRAPGPACLVWVGTWSGSVRERTGATIEARPAGWMEWNQTILLCA